MGLPLAAVQKKQEIVLSAVWSPSLCFAALEFRISMSPHAGALIAHKSSWLNQVPIRPMGSHSGGWWKFEIWAFRCRTLIFNFKISMSPHYAVALIGHNSSRLTQLRIHQIGNQSLWRQVDVWNLSFSLQISEFQFSLSPGTWYHCWGRIRVGSP